MKKLDPFPHIFKHADIPEFNDSRIKLLTGHCLMVGLGGRAYFLHFLYFYEKYGDIRWHVKCKIDAPIIGGLHKKAITAYNSNIKNSNYPYEYYRKVLGL